MRNREWLETDGLGGFASGAVEGPRTRRYHGILLSAMTPPTGRVILVNGFDAEVMTPAGRFAIATQRYAPGVDAPQIDAVLESFENEPWPSWRWRLPDGTRIVQELFIPHGERRTVMRWNCENAKGPVALGVRLYCSGRDYHSMHRENGNFNFEPQRDGDALVWRFYDGLPALRLRTNGLYRHAPHWYRNFEYEQEQQRGLDCIEDLATPGVLEFDLSAGDAVVILATEVDQPTQRASTDVESEFVNLHTRELSRRRAFASPLHRAADQYIVQRANGASIVAGYPWFTDWGRDTFIAMRGLCIASGRLDVAQSILLTWAGAISQGMIPNRFPDAGEEPEYNAVDASLWYIVGVHEFVEAVRTTKFAMSPGDTKKLQSAVLEIVASYYNGTRYGIRADSDGLLAAGERGQQLTWMDARVDGREITPRIGKPVEIQALWINALRIAATFDSKWMAHYERAMLSFDARFWNEQRSCLYDVIDCNHERGAVDGTLRPNQVLAIGGLPFAVLTGERAARALQVVEDTLWTPVGLRSLAHSEPGYAPRYEGGVAQRDGIYHQGTVWPWLIGPFVEAWLNVHGNTTENCAEAHRRFLAPLREHLNDAGIGHVSEITDADAPHTPRGCPFQAWSVGELLRLETFLNVDASKPDRRLKMRRSGRNRAQVAA